MVNLKMGDKLPVSALFYDQSPNGGEANPQNTGDAPQVHIYNDAGAEIGGSPFNMNQVGNAGNYVYVIDTVALGLVAGKSYSWHVRDPTAGAGNANIAHRGGEFKISTADADTIAAQETTNTNHLTDMKGAGWAAADNLQSIKAEETAIEGAGFNTAIDSLKIISDGVDTTVAFGAPPTVEQIEDELLDTATSEHNTAGTVGKAIIDAANAANVPVPPTSEQIEDEILDTPTSEHVIAGTVGKNIANIATYLGLGLGGIAVHSDYGGASNLKARNSVSFAPIAGVTVRFYLASDYPNNISQAFVQGFWLTLSDGTNDRVVYLAAGTYKVLFSHPDYITLVKDLVVS